MAARFFHVFPFKHLQDGEIFRLDKDWWRKIDVGSAITVFKDKQGQWVPCRGLYRQIDFDDLVGAEVK